RGSVASVSSNANDVGRGPSVGLLETGFGHFPVTPGLLCSDQPCRELGVTKMMVHLFFSVIPPVVEPQYGSTSFVPMAIGVCVASSFLPDEPQHPVTQIQE